MRKSAFHRSRWVVGAAIVGVSMAVTACAADDGGSGDGDLVTVDLAYSTTSVLSAAPFAVATENGYFTDGGCRLGEQLEEALGGANTLRSVIDGGLDMGEVATNAVLEGVLSGAEITVVGSSHQIQYDFTYAVMPDSGIDEFADMRGKRIGFTSPGSASEDMAYLLIDAAGMTPGEDVELVPTNGMGGGIALLEGGEVDATLMIPIVYEQNAEKFELGFSALDTLGPYQKTVFVASEEFAASNPDAVRCILNGLNEAMQFIVDDPDTAGEIYASYNEDYTVEELQAELHRAVEAGALDGGVGFNPEGLETVAHARELRTGEATAFQWDEVLTAEFLPDGVSADLPGR